MSLGINKNDLSFLILDTDNPKTLVFIDTSYYYKNPDRPLLEITPPGFSKYFLVNIVARQVNTLNSTNIGMTDFLESLCLSDLADGIWTFKYKICPYDQVFTIQYHLRTVRLEQTLCQIFNSLDFSDCDIQEDEFIKKNVTDIMLAIASGKANARAGNIREAHALYNIANDLAVSILNKLSKIC